MLDPNISLDLKEAHNFFEMFGRRNVPFAAALALSSTAYEARDAVRVSLPKRFTIRRPWIIKGIGVERATKSRLQAAVFSRDAFMAEQEEGGLRTGTQIIPVGRLAQTHARRIIPKSQWPGKLLDRPSYFYRAGQLFERKGKGRISPVYLFRAALRHVPHRAWRRTAQVRRALRARAVRHVALRRGVPSLPPSFRIDSMWPPRRSFRFLPEGVGGARSANSSGFF